MVYILFFFLLLLSRSFYFECMLFIRLSIGQTVILGVKEREYRSHFYLSAFLLADVVMLVIICVHRHSSILSFRSKGGGSNAFFLAFVLFVFCFFFFLSLSLVYSLSSWLRKILNGTTTGSLLVSEMLHDIVCYIVGFLFLAIMPIPIERTEEEKKRKGNRKGSGLRYALFSIVQSYHL